MPGPDYWQNRADYAIRATLDTKAKAIRGTVRIAYTNNSPNTLDVLWLHLEQNLYKADSRGYMAAGGEPRGPRSEERRVGKEGVRQSRDQGCPEPKKKKKK